MRKFEIMHMEEIFLPVFFCEFRYLIKKRNILHLQGTKAENISG